MRVEADTVASALASTWEHLAAAIPHGWLRREDGLAAWVTGIDLPTLNGAWPERVALKEAVIAEVLGQIASAGLPYCLQLRPGAPEQLAALAAKRGMVNEEPIPLMLLESTQGLKAAQQVKRLEIRQLARHEALLHAEIAARGRRLSARSRQLIAPAAALESSGLIHTRLYRQSRWRR